MDPPIASLASPSASVHAFVGAMRSGEGGVYIIRSEIRTVLAEMRRNTRWNTRPKMVCPSP